VDNERGRIQPDLAPLAPLDVDTPAHPMKPDATPAQGASPGPGAVEPRQLGHDATRARPLARWRDWLRGRGPIYAVIALGGFAGGDARYALGLVWPDVPGQYPWTTFGINVAGAFVLALVLVLILEAWDAPTWLRPLVGTGFLGAFTTFSAVVFALDRFAAADQWLLFCAYMGFSALAGLAAASFGILLGRSWVAARTRNSRQDVPEEAAAADLGDEPGTEAAAPAVASDGSSQ
jgi:CrcB protein